MRIIEVAQALAKSFMLIASFKQIILGHNNPKFSHSYMWNLFSGRPGSELKMARDQHVEHLNKYLKQGFKSLGVNLDEKNAYLVKSDGFKRF